MPARRSWPPKRRHILGVAGFIAVVWGAFVLTLLFILGVWLGDLLSGAKKGG